VSAVHPIVEAPPSLLLQRGDTVSMKPIDWLWNGWLATGKFHIMAGVGGTGKSTLALALAVPITLGGVWPDGSPAALGDVLIWSGEDTVPDVIAPRLTAMGADMGRVHFITGVVDGSGGQRTFEPSADMDLLEDAFTRVPGIKLLIVDPIMSMVSGDSNKNGQVRAALQPLVELAERHDCAVLGITHFTKGTKDAPPLERVTGSLAFGALPRVVMVVAKSNDMDEARVLMRAKSNIAPDTGGYKFELKQVELPQTGTTASCAVWGDYLPHTAQKMLDSLQSPMSEGATGAMAIAKQWLCQRLADGPVACRSLFADAEMAAISEATLKRASKALAVVKAKDGMAGGWVWKLPEDAQLTSKVINGNVCAPSVVLEHLRDSVIPDGPVDDIGRQAAERACDTAGGGEIVLVHAPSTKLSPDVLEQMLAAESMTLIASNGQPYFADRHGMLLPSPAPSNQLMDYIDVHRDEIVSMLGREGSA